MIMFRLEREDSGGSSSVGSSGVQPNVLDDDVAVAADLCLSDALRLPIFPAPKTDASSPGESTSADPYSPSAVAIQRYVGQGQGPPRISPGQCKVCGDEATGMYFGALVCVPCKVGLFNSICLFFDALQLRCRASMARFVWCLSVCYGCTVAKRCEIGPRLL